ncbi:hypothetical protein PR003_g29428 [Phytophthora rubi]|uniref:DDE-1 domain-containing protein n=1 Tax=Phytophthora rubi TaxID=129364 RepID=A0A6A4BHQ6_9STRA|nr:hypothetical protein PR003_g29428 [Phytophthora rubi]
MDTRLLQWVIEMRKNKSRCVTTECLLIMAARYEPDFRVGRTRQAAIMYLHRFRRRNRLSVRRITHRGTKQREEMEKIADEFSNTIQYYVEESGTVAHLNGLDKFSCVYNMDQTAVYIDMNPSTTIDFAGARHVDVVQVQKKAYCDEVRMLQWIEEVWKPSVSGSRLLLLDSLKTHKMESVRQKLEVGCCTEVEFIPPGIPGVAQPMDVSVMREFKRIYRDLYVGYHIDHDFAPTREARRDLITRMVVHAWHLVEPEVITRGFIRAGVMPYGPRDQNGIFHVAKPKK